MRVGEVRRAVAVDVADARDGVAEELVRREAKVEAALPARARG